MDMRELRYFVGVARAGSFSRAAAELNIAQPALSRQIQKLERELRVKLLVRSGRGVQITAAGSTLLERAEILLGLMRQRDVGDPPDCDPRATSANDLEMNAGHPRHSHSQRIGSAVGHVDQPAAKERAAIVDPHHYGFAIAEIGHAHLGPERQGAMGGGESTSGAFAAGDAAMRAVEARGAGCIGAADAMRRDLSLNRARRSDCNPVAGTRLWTGSRQFTRTSRQHERDDYAHANDA